MPKKNKNDLYTQKEFEELRHSWIEIGKREAQKEMRQKLVEALGLDVIFEPKKEDYY